MYVTVPEKEDVEIYDFSFDINKALNVANLLYIQYFEGMGEEIEYQYKNSFQDIKEIIEVITDYLQSAKILIEKYKKQQGTGSGKS